MLWDHKISDYPGLRGLIGLVSPNVIPDVFNPMIRANSYDSAN